MGRRRVHPPASPPPAPARTPTPHHKCTGLGFHEEHYTVILSPEPWPPCYLSCYHSLASPFCRSLTSYSIAVTLLLLLLLLHFAGSRPPETNLESLLVHGFNVTNNNTSFQVSSGGPWFVNGNLSVVFQVHNPSRVVGFKHQYVTTLVAAWYGSVLLGRAPPVAGFYQGQGKRRNVSAGVMVREQCVNRTTAEALRAALRQGSVGIRVAVEASVKVKRLWWPKRPAWFNFTCLNVCCRTVMQFTIAQLHELFGEQDSEFDIAYGVPCVDCRGGCTSVVLMSSLLISYEVQSKAVSVMPTNPLIQGCWEQSFPAFREEREPQFAELVITSSGVSVSLSDHIAEMTTTVFL